MPHGNNENETHVDETADPNVHALEELRPRLMAIPGDELFRDPKLDPTNAATIAAAAAKKVLPFRASLVELFGASAGTRVDELPKVARATQQADIAAAAAAAPTDLSSMHKEVRTQYDLLFTDTQALVNRHFIPETELDKARDIQGYEATVRSTLILVAILRRFWGRVQEHTPLTEADLDRASSIASRMQDTKGERDQGVLQVPANEVRMRALSLLIREYREVARQIGYLRYWEGDANAIAPSLWSGRGRRAGHGGADEDLDEDVIEDVLDEPVMSGPTSGPGVPVDPGVNPFEQ
ncbi:MAG: hypothetical protein AB7S26_07620 [Sandaracinaceae bacterium]